MWKKNNETFVPPLRIGKSIIYNPTTDQMLSQGYQWYEPIPGPAPKPKQFYTKLEIRRAMRDLGIEAKLDALLAGSELFKKEWTDAQDICLTDPTLMKAMTLGSVTKEEIKAIVQRIRQGGLTD